MILTVNTNCTQITVTSELNIINDIQVPAPTDCCHVLELGTNCCVPTLEMPIRALYNFTYDLLVCGPDLTLDPVGNVFTFEIYGIDYKCVKSISYPSTNHVGVIVENNPTDLIFNYSFNQIGPSNSIDFEVLITTCEDIVYTLNYTVSMNPGDICNTISLGLLSVTNIPLPTGVTINGSNQFVLTPEAFGLAPGTFPDGVYFVGLNQNTVGGINTESNSIFVNCSTLCRVIDVLTTDPCSDIYLVFDALRNSDSCNTITYNQKCDLWYYVGKELGYFTDTPCTKVSNCQFC